MRFKVVPFRGRWKYVVQMLYISARGEGLPMCGRHWFTVCVGFTDEESAAYAICTHEHDAYFAAREERSNVLRIADKLAPLFA